MSRRYVISTALALALAIEGRAHGETCSYQATDPALTGDAHYSLYNGCHDPFYSYFWDAYDFDGVDWNDGFGYGDACNINLGLGRTLNALSALHYSSGSPDYTSSDGYQGTILEWAGVYAADKFDELDARCGNNVNAIAATWNDPGTDHRTELFMSFFNNYNVAERAATLVHEARHASGKDHGHSGCAFGNGQCDSNWADKGAFRYQVSWAAEFVRRSYDAPTPVKQRLVDRTNFVLDNGFATHPGFYLEHADVPLLADVDGDGRDELVVWRPVEGFWFAIDPITYEWTTYALQFGGQVGDVPLVGNFDNDKLEDFAIWRPSDGTWHFITAAGAPISNRQYGQSGDVPLVGDFNGDGVDDISVWRPSHGTWDAATKDGQQLFTRSFGRAGDRPLVGDYDGDGKDDIFIWRPSTGEWHVIASLAGGPLFVRQWGGPGDRPLVGDFNHDKKVDLAIWRPSTGEWHAVTSAGAPLFVRQWGESGDVPLLGKIDANKTHDLVVWRPSSGTWWALGTNAGQLFGNVQFGMPY